MTAEKSAEMGPAEEVEAGAHVVVVELVGMDHRSYRLTYTGLETAHVSNRTRTRTPCYSLRI